MLLITFDLQGSSGRSIYCLDFTRNDVTVIGSHTIHLEKGIKSGPSGSKCITQLQRGSSVRAPAFPLRSGCSVDVAKII